MVLLRSLLFNVAFVLGNFGWFLKALPLLGNARRDIIDRVAKPWVAFNLRLHARLCRVRFEIRGAEKIPSGGVLVAAKHQSAWETFAVYSLFDDAAYVLKEELMRVPLFGTYLRRTGQIAIKRGDRAAARAVLAADARAAIGEGRQIIVFPEGTRRPVDAPPAYKQGLGHLYTMAGAPCVPVAHNAGLFWPRRSFLKYPGTVTVEVLDPIPPGLPRREFMALIETRIEAATNRLVAEARARGEGAPGSRFLPTPAEPGVDGREAAPRALQPDTAPSDATPGPAASSAATSRPSVLSATPSDTRL